MKTDCITDEVLAAWANGNVTPDVVDSIQKHISSCASCRTVAAEVARTAGSRPKPKTLGRYELREPIGAGGMGTVFAAWDPTVSRQVAVKLLHEAAVDSHRAERFLLERQVLGGLEHPHIARLLDAGETEAGQPWFAMDFIDGKPLDQACDDAKLNVYQRVKLMLPVLRAVTAAHQHLVVHRDLKPSNILVDTRGEPHLVDFGIARLLEGASGLTQTGVTPMTPAYASPEQVRREPVAVTTDVYSLGVVLYELLTGVSPYDTKPGDVEGVLKAITRADVKPPSEAVTRATDAQVAARGLTREHLRSALQGDLDAIVMMALRKEPQDRYQSVQALTDDLVASLERRPTLARRGDRAYRAALFVRRNRVLVAGAVAAIVALSVGLVATIWQARRAEAERDLAQARFEQVRQLARSVLFKYHDGIADLPGSTKLREDLVVDAQGYLTALAAQAQHDIGLEQELAFSYLKLGDVQGDPFSASLGHTAAARASYLEGRRLAEAVLAAEPKNVDGRRALAASAEKLAAIEEVTGNLEDAVKGYIAAADIERQLLSERPGDLDDLAMLGRCELATAQTLNQLGRIDEAAPHLDKSLEARRAVATKRGDAGSRRGVAAALITLAQLRADQLKLPDAFAAAEEAATIFEALATENPDAVEFQRGVQQAHSTLAALFKLAGEPRKALEHNKQEMAVARAMLARDPENSVAQRDFMSALDNLSRTLTSVKQPAESWAVSEEAVQMQKNISARDPENTQSRRDLMLLLSRSAYIALNVDKTDVAEARAREVIAMKFPEGEDNMVTAENRGFAWHTLSLALAAKARFADAKPAAVEYVRSLEAQVKANPTQERLRNRLALATNAQAVIWVRAAEHTRARADWEAADVVVKEAEAISAPLEQSANALEELKAMRVDREALQARVTAALDGKPLAPMRPVLESLP